MRFLALGVLLIACLAATHVGCSDGRDRFVTVQGPPLPGGGTTAAKAKFGEAKFGDATFE